MPPLVAIAIAGFAHAQSELDAHGFALGDARADARAPLLFPVAAQEDAGNVWVGTVFEYANKPWVTAPAGGESVVQVPEIAALNGSVGWAPSERLRLSVTAPVFLSAAPVSVGDVRATGVLSPFATDDLDAGIAVTAVLPSGAEAQSLGLSGPAGEFLATGRMRVDNVQLAAATGFAARPNTDPDQRPAPTQGGDAWLGNAAISWLIEDRGSVGFETRADIPLDPVIRTGVGTSVEMMLTGRLVHEDGGHWMAGLGTSPTRGVGAPAFRAVVGGGWGSPRNEVVEPDAVVEVVEEVEEPEEVEPTSVLELVVTPSEDAQVWIEHPICRWVPLGEAQEMLADMPADATLLIQSPGFLPRTVRRDAGEVTLEPAPPQGGLVVVAKPGDSVFVGRQQVEGSEAGVFLINLPEGDYPIRVEGSGGRTYRDEVATISGYATWLRVPELRSVEVFFDVGQSGLKPSSRSALSGIAVEPGELVYEVRGSYSPEGRLEANLALANARAQTVANALVRFGVPRDQVRLGLPLPPKPGVTAAEQRRVTVTPVETR